KKRIFVIAITSRVQSAALFACRSIVNVRWFFLKTQPRPGGALLCAARLSAVGTSRYGRADGSKRKSRRSSALPDSSPRRIRTASSSMRKRTWLRLQRILAPQADSAKPLKHCLQVHESGRGCPAGAIFYFSEGIPPEELLSGSAS